jgi:hypothetical protein
MAVDLNLIADESKADPHALSAMLPFQGVLFSACPTGKDIDRSLSINLGFRWMHFTDASSDNRYAGGNRITIATIVPALSWRPFHSGRLRKLDFFDLSTGAGAYWITSGSGAVRFDDALGLHRVPVSSEIKAFSGVLIEPIRVDVHAPTVTADRLTLARALLEMPTFRIGGLTFPGGFERNAFGGDLTGAKAERRQGEWVWSAAVFADIGPLTYYLKNRGKSRSLVPTE